MKKTNKSKRTTSAFVNRKQGLASNRKKIFQVNRDIISPFVYQRDKNAMQTKSNKGDFCTLIPQNWNSSLTVVILNVSDTDNLLDVIDKVALRNNTPTNNEYNNPESKVGNQRENGIKTYRKYWLIPLKFYRVVPKQSKRYSSILKSNVFTLIFDRK